MRDFEKVEKVEKENSVHYFVWRGKRCRGKPIDGIYLDESQYLVLGVSITHAVSRITTFENVLVDSKS